MLTGLQAQITSASLSSINPGPNFCTGSSITVNFSPNTVSDISLFLSNTNGAGTFTSPAIATQASGLSGSITGVLPFDLAPGTYNFKVENASAPAGSAETGSFTVLTRTLTGTYSGIPNITCIGDQITVPFSSNCAFPVNSEFTLELSQANGTFPGTIISGAPVLGTGNGSIMGTIPNVTEGNQYRVRVVSNQSQNTIGQTISAASNSFIISRGATIAGLSGPFCQGQQNITVNFTPSASVTYNSGNVFSVQLSDASGVFPATPVVLGTITSSSNAANSITIGIPFNIPAGTGYRIRISSSSPSSFCSPSTSTFTINGPGPLMVNDVMACLGDMANFSATFGSPLGSTTFQWYKLCVGPFVNTVNGLRTGLNPALVNEVTTVGTSVYAATNNGLSYSTDNGLTYTLVPIGGTLSVNDVAVNGTNVFVATNDGIWSSNSGGTVSGSFNQALSGQFVHALFVVGSKVYVGTTNGLYEFTYDVVTNSLAQDAHYTTADGLGSDQVNGIFVKSGIIFAATSGGLSIKFNPLFPFFNRNLSNSGLASNNVRSVFESGGIIYAGTANGLSVSTNGGSSFSNVLPGESINDIFISSGLIYLATINGLKVTTSGSDTFTTYLTQDGLGQNSTNGVFVTASNDVFVANNGGISKGSVSFGAISGEMSSSYSLNPVAYPDANCRYLVQATHNGCPQFSNIAMHSPIPPQISVDSVRHASTCVGADGSIRIKGLIPNAQYKIFYTGGNGSPASGSNITTDTLGRFRIKFVPGGNYMVWVQNTTGPCISNKLPVTVNKPPKPLTPVLSSAPPVCAGEDLVINMGPLGANQQYRWYLDMATSSSANPLSSGSTFTPAPPPTTSGSYWVRVRNTATNCFSDSLKVDYVVKTQLSISITKSNPTTNGGNDGKLTISGLEPSTPYTLSYGGLVGTPAAGGVTSDAQGLIVISGLTAGNVTNISVSGPSLTTCPSNSFAICSLFDPGTDPIANKLQTTVCEIPGTMGGYLQQIDQPACNISSDHFVDGVSGIAVGRIRQSRSLPNPSTDKVEMRGYLKFDLSRIPTNATITKVEYRPRSWEGGIESVCDISPIVSATGDIQFDITQVKDANYSPYGSFNSTVFEDLQETKYNDFVIARNSTGAITDLGTTAVEDVQRRLKGDKLFQIGLNLSGNDFDLPVFQFHGIVFAPSPEHELCITYTLRDYGDLPEPRYTTDILGGLLGASHLIDSVDLDPTVSGVNRQPAMFIGATPPDPELDGQPSAMANADDNTIIDDEDLSESNFLSPTTFLPYPLVSSTPTILRVPVTNNLNKSATLWAFIDWNGDGSFTGPGETNFKTVSAAFAGNIDFNLLIPKVSKPDSIGVRVRLTSGQILDAHGEAPDGEVEDFMVELRGIDLGDLPDLTAGVAPNDFQTYGFNNGPTHGVQIKPLTFMGRLVDTEAEGKPNGEADGDDKDQQPDDEDGIIFLGPLVPGKTAQLSFSGTNSSTLPADLNMWADWDGDGTLEYVNTTTIPPSTVANAQIISFSVPTSATFLGGKVFFRFRFTTDPAFNANPLPTGPAWDGEVEDYYKPIFKLGNLVWEDRNHNGFQDDNEINLGIKNVRVVLRYGGVDPITGAYDSVTQNTVTNPNTKIVDGGKDLIVDSILQTYTDDRGQYCFLGLIEGSYQVIAVDTFGLTPTRFDWIKNVKEEDQDSDGKPLKNPWDYISGDRRQSKSSTFLMTANRIGTDEEGILDQINPQLLDPNALGGYPDERVEQRIDFGYVGLDLGDLAESGNNPSVTNFITSENGTKPEGPKHIVTPDLRLGKCQDVEWQGQPDQDAGAEFKPGPDAGGDDPIADFSNYPTFPYDPSQGRRWPFHDATNACGDDEDGIRFLTPMVPGYNALMSVKYYAKLNLDGPDAYLHTWIDWNGDGNFDDGAGNYDPDEHIRFSLLDGKPAILEPNTHALELEMNYLVNANDSIVLTFKVPANVKYNNGNILSRFRISFDPRIGPNGILAPNLNFPDPQPGAVSSQVPGGVIPYGEVEDYFISLAKVGNTVFEDRDYDGFQDVLEPGIANVPIKLQFAGADGILNSGDPYEFTYHDTTDANGRYFFCGLLGNVDPSGIPNPVYQLIVSDPAGMTATFNNPDPSDDACIDDNSNGDDLLIDNRITTDTFTITNPMMLCLDENAPRNDVGGLVAGNNLPPSADALNNFPDNQYDETRDFGYTGFDYGDLPVSSILSGSNYLTLRDSMNALFNNQFGARHAIQPRLFLGRGVDGELNGKPDADAGSKAGGDDDDPGAFKKGLTTDDETGVRLLSPLIPGEYAYIKVNYTSQDTAAGGYVNRTAYLDAFIDWNGDGVLDPTTDEKVLFTHQALSTGSPFSTNNVPDITDTRTPVLPATGANGVDSTILAFLVPTNAVYDSGTVFMRFRLGWTNYSTSFPTAFPNGLEPDNNKFHMKASPYVKSFENNLPLGAPVTFNDVAGDLGRYPYPQGEVEDYAIPVAKIGNLAWFDHDVFGDQDLNEDVVDSLHLVLIWGGVDGATGAFDTVGYQTSLSSLGAVTDILYNRSIAPPGVGTYTPGALVKTGISPAPDSGMYSFRGLIPGIYYVLPQKYFAADSATFVNAWPKHRVVTLQDNPGVDDNNDSDGITTGVNGPRKGPGAFVKIADGNNRQPEVCVNDRPLAENGKQDAQDNANPLTPVFFPDNQWDKSVDIGWVDEPNVEASMDIVGVNFPTSQICGNFNVITHLCIKNPQEVPLDSLQMFFNLLNAYGPALYTASKPIVTVVDSAFVTNPKDVKVKKSSLINYNTAVNAKAKDLLVVNPNYNGTTDTRLLVPTSESANFILRGDSILCVQIEFEIDPTKTANYPWMLSALVSGRAVGFNKQTGLKRPLTDFRYFHPRFGKTIVVYDSTDEFDDPMPMASLAYPLGGDNILFEGMVADRGLKGDYQPPYVSPNVTGRDKYIDEDDKAIMNDSCWIKTKWNSGYQEFQIGLDENCEAIINADKLVPNYIPACGFDKYPMGSYYRVIIQDKHTEETLWASVDRVPFDASKYLDRKLIYKVRSVANHCNVIWGPILFVDKLAPVVTCPPTTSRKLNSKNQIVGTHTFICSDIDSVLNVTKSWADSTYAYYTGLATATDACSTPRLDNVKDEIVFISDCALSSTNGFIYAQIRRTFTFADAMGNKGICSQLINFYRPRIVLPVCKILVPNNKAKGDTLIALTDLVGKKYELPQGVPHYVNGSGKKVYITGQDLCGFAFNYTDEVTFVTGEEGGCGKKIIRHWSIFDWCYGKGENYPNYVIIPDSNNTCYADSKWEGGRYSWKQTIVVGDDEKPIIQALDIDKDGNVGYYSGEPQADPTVATPTYDPDDVLTFSTGPMDCTGSFIFDRSSFKVIEQSDWCYDIKVFERVAIKDLDERPTGKFEMKLGPTVTVKGDCAKGFQVTGVPMVGDWFVQVRVYDACYSSDTAMIPIRILDKIVPVMKCDDKFNITLDNLGNGHIAAKDLDEGSWDNCKLKWVKVRRPVIDACQQSLLGMSRLVDANKNGKIDTLDFIDFNRNTKGDEGEFFEIAKGTKQLMTPLMDTVPFFCCDGGSLMVELWGEDKFGNRNFCWHTTQIEDKTPVECVAPSAVRIFCTDKNLGTLDSKVQSARAFGDVIIVRGATCAAVDTTYTTVKKLKCGAGTIERIWTLTKKTAHGPIVSTCKQIITVLPLREYDIRFPKDVDTRDCSKPLIDTLRVDEHSCDILAINITDKRYDKSADECYKIFRTYTVIDWCAYDERCGDPMATNVAYVVERKYSDNGLRPVFVLVRDEDRNQREEFYLSADDVIHKGALLNDGIVEPKDNNDESFTPNFCEIAFSGSAEGLPTGAYIHSFMYTQVIKVYDDIQPVVTVTPDTTCIRDGGDCLANPQIIVNAKDNCTDDVTLETNLLMVAPFQTLDRTQMILYSTTHWEVKKLDKGKFEVNIKDLPMGKHDLIVVVRDECGNLSAPTRIPLIIQDCKGPAPICINGLSIELMPNGSGDGSALVWATDFVASKIFDCNGQGPETQGNGKLVTKYSINRVGSPVSATQTSLAFNCKDAGKIIQIELHAWDELGNHDFCVTFIQVQDNNKACGGTGGTTETGQIAGLILTDDAEPVQSVAVEVGGASTQKANTGTNGGFNIGELKKGGDYTVSAQHDKDHGNGVSTFDLVLIQKHILNVQPITSPYRLIAADVNNSKTITTLDLIQIRKLILQIDDKFKSVPSWKFIDATYKFQDATNPFAQDYPEVININNLTALAKADFVAVKMGDVNGNAATSPQAVKSEIRTNRAFLIEAKDELMKANQQYEIPVRARDLQQIQGYQFTLKYDLAAVELLSMDYGLSKAENFGVFTDKGLITSSWNSNTTAKHDPNAYLFSLVVKAKTTAKVSDVLKISSQLTSAEAYDVQNQTIGVKLTFDKDRLIDNALLHQNQPNPFSDETLIGFYLPKAAKGTLTIRDAKGSLVYSAKTQYVKGENTVLIKRNELRESGVFYYTLETEDFVDTKKMVLLTR
jgi:hypothetical protein